jgi:hypothetical protein
MSKILDGGLSLIGLFTQYGEIRTHVLTAAREILLALRSVTKPVLTALEGRENDPAAKRALELFTGLDLLLELVLRRAPGASGDREAAKREALDAILEVMEAEMELARREPASQKQTIRIEVLQSIREVLAAEREKAGGGAAGGSPKGERIHIE